VVGVDTCEIGDTDCEGSTLGYIGDACGGNGIDARCWRSGEGDIDAS
jgi:hypothetical protein